VYGILNQCNGLVLVDTALDRGTEFRIYFPRIEPGETMANPSPEEGALSHGSETILLVEDEEITRNAIGRALERVGYSVLAAKDGKHAIQVCMYSRESIDLLVTDVVMPRMGGKELALVCQRLHPEMKQILISGYSEPDRLPVPKGAGGYRFMAKPFQMSHLLQLVREVLASPGQPSHQKVG
jgi:DNA-binding NtrC family response regulator